MYLELDETIVDVESLVSNTSEVNVHYMSCNFDLFALYFQVDQK